jgi:Fur family transcriptional regulator, ferric uptake regulator
MIKPKFHFSKYLGEQGLKMTSERERILEEIFDLEGHFEADELTYRLRSKGEKISKATVYRTLPLLVTAGLIKEVIHGEKHLHYEHVHDGERHDHLICLTCGKIIEFEEPALRRIEKQICQKNGFTPKKIVFEIFGYCRRCQ